MRFEILRVFFFSLSQRRFFLNAFSSLERSSPERFITTLKGKKRESKNRFSRDGTLSVSPTPPEKCYSFSVMDELQRQQRSVNFLSAGGVGGGGGGGRGGYGCPAFQADLGGFTLRGRPHCVSDCYPKSALRH